MAIGKRIEQRLKDLEWERADLLSALPDLSAQALSNLIRRDSKRSEWDQAIAKALKTSVLWLVYGEQDESPTKLCERENTEYQDNVTMLPQPPVDPLLSELIALEKTMNERGQIELIGQARMLAHLHPKAKANRVN